MKLFFGTLVLGIVATGCAAKQEALIPPITPVTTTGARVHGKGANEANGADATAADEAAKAAAAAEAARKAAEAGRDTGMNTASLHISDEIVKACGLTQNESSPHFDFDSATIPDQDRELLASISKCLAGPLKEKHVVLIGRADNRGEDEYNMGLGESRSHVVKRYLVDLGVGEKRVTASSRGEIDAVGTDEETRAKDRRVDIEVR